MATYYIDISCTEKNNDGLSEQSPLCSCENLSLLPGDCVLFKCGSVIRGKLNNIGGTEDKPITYSSYGTGEKPTFCGSVNLHDKSLWVEEEKNVWRCLSSEICEAANLIFNNSDLCASLKWSKSELSKQGDFYDSCFGVLSEMKSGMTEHFLYLYSELNPAEYYTAIECAVCRDRSIASNGENMIIKGLRFVYCGLHAIAGEGESRNILIENCDFEYIGGAVYDPNKKIRYGNALEFWNVCENVEVRDCRFYNIYDSAVTHQGGAECIPAKNFYIHDNLFIKCGMAAYEQRDKLPVNSRFCNNICVDAGEGFSKNGVIMPRMSEIWPQPMGHHVFLWRINEKSVGGSLEISKNIFYNAPYGAAVYSIISECAEEQISVNNNIYYTENKALLSRWRGKNCRDFLNYRKYESDCEYKKVNINHILNIWKTERVKS